MRIRHAVFILVLAGGLVACEDETPTPEVEEELGVASEDEPAFISEDEVSAAPPGVPERAETDPKLAAERFFQVVKDGEDSEVTALIAQQPTELSGDELQQYVRQWRQNLPPNAQFEVLDAHRQGDFAIVRAVLPGAGENGGDTVRPVILFQEDGQWKVVWELMGMEPDQVAQMATGTRELLEPLYKWYEQEALRADSDADLPGQGTTPASQQEGSASYGGGTG